MFSMINKIEKDYVVECLKQKIRQDQRDFMSYRDIVLKKLYENGQVQCQIGKTNVLSQIFSSIVSPLPDKPTEGFVIFNIDTYNLKHSAEATNSNEELSELRNRISNLLEKSLKESK